MYLTSLMYDIISTNKYKINKKYFYYYFKFINKQIRENCLKGACQPSLNFEVFNNLEVPLPLIEDQNKIIEHLDNIYDNEIKRSIKTIEGLERCMTIITNKQNQFMNSHMNLNINQF
jgi:restriction endonuclease S subunit